MWREPLSASKEKDQRKQIFQDIYTPCWNQSLHNSKHQNINDIGNKSFQGKRPG